jgi:hypothetical protein
MARARIEKIESSIKGGVVAQPGAKTLILGRNGRGKSAIVNAAELAGTGAASDVAGRAVLARDTDLFMLAPPDAARVWATARLTGSAGTASWELEKGHRAKRTGPEISFPLRDVRAALLGSPETARKWILEVGGSFEWSEVEALVPESLHKRLRAITVETEGAAPDATEAGAASALVFALEAARSKVREENAKAKAARSLSPPPLPPPTDQEISAIEAIVSAWLAMPPEGTEPAGDVVRAAREKVQIEVDRLFAEARGIEETLASLPAPTAGLELRRAAVSVVEAMATTKACQCAICGSGVSSEIWAPRAAQGRKKIEEAVEIEVRRVTLETSHRNILPTLAAARRELQRLTTEEARAAQRTATTGAARPTMTLQEAQRKVDELRTTRAGWTASKRSEEQALAAELAATEWGQLADALAVALGKLVEKAREAFRVRVQKYLPREDLFGLDLLDGEREILRVGLLRPSGDRMVLHAALSGAEWARVTAAIALATAPTEGPCGVCPEERAFDPETLSDVLAAFDAAIGTDENAPQLFVTSPVEPTKIPPGWTVIRTGDGEKITPADPPEPAGGKKTRKKGKSDPEDVPPARPLSSIFD